jgi:hypothetical protein
MKQIKRLRAWWRAQSEADRVFYGILAWALAASALAVFMGAALQDAGHQLEKAKEGSQCVNNAVYYTYYVHGDDASYAQMKANLAHCETGFWLEEKN